MRTHSLADLPGALRDLADWLDGHGFEKLDRLYWHKVRMARLGPDVHFARTREIEEPYRTGRSVVFHLEPFRPGIVIGWYGKPTVDPYDENAVSEALRRAVTIRKPTQKELDDFDDERKLHGPGKPVGLRFGATGGIQVRGERPRPGMVVIDPDGLGQ